MTKAIRIDQFGGPEVLEWRDVELPELGSGDALIRHSAVGLNFIDTYHRSGLYPLELPTGLGTEAAGVVEQLGADVTHLSVGDRVAYLRVPPGSYAEQRVLAADVMVRLPDEISDETAAAGLLKGLTAWYLVKRSFPVSAGDNVLLYAAAGGVGQIAAQWATALGARVIGVVSSAEKEALARQAGCADVVRSDTDDFVGRVRELTNGEGVAAVYDSVGRETFFQSLDCLKPHGTMVTFGNATGAVEPFSPMELAKRGSLFVTRPVVFDFIRARDDLEAATNELFQAIVDEDVSVNINHRFRLQDVAEAHAALEARRTTGSTIFTLD